MSIFPILVYSNFADYSSARLANRLTFHRCKCQLDKDTVQEFLFLPNSSGPEGSLRSGQYPEGYPWWLLLRSKSLDYRFLVGVVIVIGVFRSRGLGFLMNAQVAKLFDTVLCHDIHQV